MIKLNGITDVVFYIYIYMYILTYHYSILLLYIWLWNDIKSMTLVSDFLSQLMEIAALVKNSNLPGAHMFKESNFGSLNKLTK